MYSQSSISSTKGRPARSSSFFDTQWRILPFLSELQALPGEYPILALYAHVVWDVIQVISFALLQQNSWGTVMTGFTRTMNFTHIPLYDYLGVGHLTCFIVAVFITVVYFGVYVYVVVKCFRMESYVAGSSALDSIPFRLLRGYLYLMAGVLFVPVIQNLLAVAFVKSKNLEEGVSSHLAWFPSVLSSDPMAKAGIAVCAIGITLHVCVAYIADTHYVECDFASIHPLRRSNTFPDSLYLIYRLISCILFHYFYSADMMKYFSIWMAASSALMAGMYTLVLPFYSEDMNKVRIMALCLAAVYSALSGIAHIDAVGRFFQTRNYAVDAIVFFCTVPIFGFLAYWFVWRWRLSAVYVEALQELKMGRLSNPVVHIPKNLPRNIDTFSHYSALLDELEATKLNYINDDDDFMLDDDLVEGPHYAMEDIGVDPHLAKVFSARHVLSRFIAPYIDTITIPSDVEVSVRFLTHFRDVTAMDLSGYQLRYAATIYLKALCKYREDPLPRLDFIIFLLYQANNPRMALTFTQELRRMETPLWVSFLSWRLEAETSNRLRLGQNNRVAALNKAKEAHLHVVHNTTEFWYLLINQSNHSTSLSAISNTLMESVASSRSRYAMMLANDPGNPEVLSCYAVFCDQVLDDTEMAGQCVQFIRQTVETRQQDKMRGAKMKAAIGASLTQLKLSLQASSDNAKRYWVMSRVRFLPVAMVGLCVLSIACLVVVLVLIILRYSSLRDGENCVYFLGKLRTLTTQMATAVLTIQNNNVNGYATGSDITGELVTFRLDFMSFYNELLFGPHSRSTPQIKSFLRDMAVRREDSGLIIHLWAYVGVAIGGIQDIISRPAESPYVDWIAEDFNRELTLALSTASTHYHDQQLQDASTLLYICIPLLVLVIMLMLLGILLFYNGVYRVKGVQAITYALLGLIPMKEMRRVYKRSLQQHLSLDSYLSQSTRDKVLRLLSAAEEADRQHLKISDNRHASTTYKSLLQRVSEANVGSLRYFMSATTTRNMSSGSDMGGEGKVANGKPANIAAALGRRGEDKYDDVDDSDNSDEPKSKDAAIQMGHQVEDADQLNSSGSSFDESGIENGDDDDSGYINNDDDTSVQLGRQSSENSPSSQTFVPQEGNQRTPELELTEGELGTSRGDLNRKRRERARATRRRRRVQEELDLEMIISKQSYILSRDSSATDVAFTPVSLVMFAVLMLLFAGLIIVSIRAIPHPRATSKFYVSVMESDLAVRNIKVNVVFSLMNAMFFTLKGDQRYYNDYIVSRGKEQWDQLHTLYADRMTNATFAAQLFELETMYNGIIEVLDIIMRLACSTFLHNCVTNRLPFKSTFISTLQWDNEDTLIMTNLAAKVRMQATYFGVLSNSTVDLGRPAPDQINIAKQVLASDLLNNFADEFFIRLDKVNPDLWSVDYIFFCYYSLASGIVSAVLAAFLIAMSVWQYRVRSRVMTCAPIVILRALTLLLLIAVVTLSFIGVVRNNKIKVNTYMEEARVISSKWNFALWKMFWYPLMYMGDQKMVWNYRFRELKSSFNNGELLHDLSTVGGVQFSADDEQRLEDAQRLLIISMVLIYEATKNDPAVLPFSSIFDDTYLNTFNWDFSKERDYYTTLATFGNVDTFYSSRKADLQLPPADMLQLAASTLISNREDQAIKLLYSYVLQSDSLVEERLAKDNDVLNKQSNLFTAVAILSAMALLCLLVSFACALVMFSRNLVRVNRWDADSALADKGASGKVPIKSTEASKDQTAKTESGAYARGDGGAVVAATPGRRPSDQQSVMSVEYQQSSSVIDDSAERATAQTSIFKPAASFILFLVVIGTTVAVIVLLVVFTNYVHDMDEIMNDATERSWIVAQTVYLAKQVNDDFSNYATVAQKLEALNHRHSSILNELYFKNYLEEKGGYKFIVHDKVQDDFLFSRNQFYNGIRFLGPGNGTDSTDDNGYSLLYVANDSEYSSQPTSSPFFCSYKVESEVETLYARGLGLFYDGVWPLYLRTAFSGDANSFADAYQNIEGRHRAVLIGLAQSDYIYHQFVAKSVERYFILLLTFTAVSIVLIIGSLATLWVPYALSLINQDTITRLLVRTVPPDIREKYPMFTQFLNNRARSLTDEDRINQTMTEMARAAVVASDARGIIIRFNDIAEDLFGYNAAEMIGRNVTVFMPPEMGTTHQSFIDNFDETGGHYVNRTRELRARCKSGKMLDVTIRLTHMRLPSSDENVFIALFEEIGDRNRLAVLEQINHIAIEMNPDGIILIDSTGIMLRVNHGAAESFQYEVDEMVGKNVSMLMPDEIGQFHNGYLQRYLDSGVKRRIDSTTNIPGKRKDGTEFRLNITITELKNPNEQTYFLGYLEDATENRKLEETHKAHHVTVNLSPIPIIGIDANDRLVEFSKSASDLLQYKSGEKTVDPVGWMGSVKNILPDSYEDNHSSNFFGRSGKVMQSPEGPRVMKAAMTAVKKDSTTVPVEVIACDVPPNHMMAHQRLVMAYLNDASREVRLRDMGRVPSAVFQVSAYPILVMDSTGVVTSLNRSVLECFGYSAASELIGKNCSLLSYHCDAIAVEAEKTAGSALLGGGNANSMPSVSPTSVEGDNWKDSVTMTSATTSGDATAAFPQHCWLGDYPRTLKKGRHFNTTRNVTARRKDGTAFSLELRMVEVTGMYGERPTVVAFLRDLTEDQRVRQSFHIGETLEAVCPMGITVVDINGRIIQVSPAAEECFGFHASEVLDANISVLVPSLICAQNLGNTNVSVSAPGGHSNVSQSTFTSTASPWRYADADNSVTVTAAIAIPTVHLSQVARKGRHTVVGRRCDGRHFPLQIRVEELEMQNPRDIPLYAVYSEDINTEVEADQFATFHRHARELLDAPLAHLDSRGHVISANEAFLQELGHSTGNVYGKPFTVMCASTNSQQIYATAIQRYVVECEEKRDGTFGSGIAMTTKNATSSAAVLVWGERPIQFGRADGTTLFATCRLVGVSSMQSGTVSFIAFLAKQDVRHEEQLAWQMSDLMLDLGPFAVILSDAHGIIVQISQTATKLFGYSTTKELVGVSISQLVPSHFVEAGGGPDGEFLSSLRQGAMLGNATEVMARHCNGHLFPVEFTLREVPHSSTDKLFVACVRCLAEPRQASRVRATNTLMLEQLPVAAVITNREGVIEQVNWVLCREFGYSSSELLGRDVGVLMTAEDAQYHRRHMANYMRTRMKFSIDNTLVRTARRRDDEIFKIKVHIKEIPPASGEAKDTRFVAYMTPEDGNSDGLELGPLGTLVSSAASTVGPAAPASTAKRRRMESVLPQNEINGRRVRSLDAWLSESGVSFAVVDEVGTVLGLSKAAEDIFGCTEGKMNGLHLSSLLAREKHRNEMYTEILMVLDVLNRVHSDHDHDHAFEGLSVLLSAPPPAPTATEVEAASRKVLLVQRRSGEWFPVEMCWRKVDSSATVVGLGALRDGTVTESTLGRGESSVVTSVSGRGHVYVVTLHDIKETQSAARLKEIYDGAVEMCRVPTIFSDAQGVIKVFNKAAERCFGWTAAEVIGQNVKILMPRRNSLSHDHFMENYLRSGVAHMVGSSRDITGKRRDGTHFPAIVTLREVREAAGHFFIAHIADNTEAARSEVMGMMGRAVMADTTNCLLVLNAKDEVLHASAPAVAALRYEQAESELMAAATAETPSIMTATILSSTAARALTTFVHENINIRAKEHVGSIDTNSASGSLRWADDVARFMATSTSDATRQRMAAKLIATAPHITIPAVAMQCRDGTTTTTDVEVCAVFGGSMYCGCVLRLLHGRREQMTTNVNLAASGGTANEVAARKAKEELQLVAGWLRHFPRPLFVVNRAGRFAAVNPPLAALLGYASHQAAEEQLLGERVDEVFPAMVLPMDPSGGVGVNPESSASLKATVEHERSCVAALSEFTTTAPDPSRLTSGGSGSANASPHVLKATGWNGTSKKVLLDRFEGVSTARRATSGGPRGSPATNYSGAHFFLGEVSDMAAAHRDAVNLAVSKSLLQSFPTPVVIVQAITGVVVSMSQSVQTVFDFVEDHVVGQRLSMLMHLEGMPPGDSGMQTESMLARMVNPDGVLRMVGESRTGRTFPLEVTAHPVPVKGVACLVVYMSPV